MRRAAPPLRRNSATCALVACEQLPETIALNPFTAGSDAASPDGGDGEVARQADRQARAGADQRQVANRLAEAVQVVVVDRVGDRDRDAFAPQGVEARPDRRGRSAGRAVIDEADAAGRAPVRPRRRELRLQDADEVGVGHRRQRMVAHAALGEQHVADEEMALEDRARVVGERRRRDREVAAELVHQRLEHRADVAARRRVEGRADLEVDLRRAGSAQPAACRERLLDRELRLDRSRLERDDDRIGVERRRRSVAGNADRLHRPHAGADQVVGEVGGAGEVVGDAAEADRHRFGAGSSMPGKILITAASSSLAKPAVDACMNIWCAVLASGSGNLVARAVSRTRPRSLTKMSTAESGV